MIGHIILRRTASALAGLVVASVVIFLALSVLGGDAATVVLGDQATQENITALRQRFGLDVSPPEQYLRWMKGMVTGDLGRSHLTGAPVGPELRRRLPVTLPLTLLGLSIALLIALPAGLYSAVRHQRASGALISAGSQVGMAIPVFWAALMLSSFFAVRVGWFPSGGFVPWSESVPGALESLVLPAVSLGIIQAAIFTRYVRSAILDVMRSDYIQMARATGLTWTQSLWRHGLRNAAIPLVTVVGLQFGVLLGGTIIIENVFYLPGLGSMIVGAVNQRDLIVVQSVTLVLTAIIVATNLATDLSYRFLDPRLRSQ